MIDNNVAEVDDDTLEKYQFEIATLDGGCAITASANVKRHDHKRRRYAQAAMAQIKCLNAWWRVERQALEWAVR